MGASRAAKIPDFHEYLLKWGILKSAAKKLESLTSENRGCGKNTF